MDDRRTLFIRAFEEHLMQDNEELSNGVENTLNVLAVGSLMGRLGEEFLGE